MVGEVEGIEAEGEELILKGLKALLQAGVVVRRAGTDEDIAIALLGEGARGWSGEDVGAVAVLRGEPRVGVGADGEFAVPTKAGSRCDLQELGLKTCAYTGDVLTGGHTERSSGLELIGLRELPAAEGFVDETAAAVERNVIHGSAMVSKPRSRSTETFHV